MVRIYTLVLIARIETIDILDSIVRTYTFDSIVRIDALQ